MKNYYVVIDLEFVKVNGIMRQKFGCGTEIVQIGAVLLDEKYEKKDSFSTYVAPQYGRLDNEIRKLTGMKNQDFAGAPNFCTALDQLFEWLPDNGNIAFVEWSTSDEKQLLHEISFYHYQNDKLIVLFNSWIDCQLMFGEYMNEPQRKYALQNAITMTELPEVDFREHDGLADAYNTATIFSMLKNDCLKLNAYYKKAHEGVSETSGCTLGDLFAGFNIQFA